MDYYKVLGVSRDASDDSIKRAYRKLALQWHPNKNAEPDAADNFNDVAEAYEVLMNKDHRAVFDQYGENGLKSGVPDASGALRGGYQFNGNSAEIFEAFFGTSNPFSDFGFGDVDPAELYADSRRGKQGPTMNVDLPCTLEELYNGAVKKVPFTRRRLSDDGRSTRQDDATLTIRVRPGWKDGTRVTFPKEGDESPSTTASDVVFTVKQQQHDSLVRDGDDLVHNASIKLVEALTDHTVQIDTLDGRTLSIPCNEVISPGYEKRVAGEGMPVSKSDDRGDLVLRFSIVFPPHIDTATKEKLRGLL